MISKAKQHLTTCEITHFTNLPDLTETWDSGYRLLLGSCPTKMTNKFVD